MGRNASLDVIISGMHFSNLSLERRELFVNLEQAVLIGSARGTGSQRQSMVLAH